VRENDYAHALYNGDTGVLVRVETDDRGAELRAAFPEGASLRLFPLAALRSRIEHAFALTVHQSQGCEFDHVALVLPTADTPLATRELCYTAVTRARRSVALVGDRDLLKVAIGRTIERHSGLAEIA
jgi:exodeoxyribonuclease V alpha subunit